MWSVRSRWQGAWATVFASGMLVLACGDETRRPHSDTDPTDGIDGSGTEDSMDDAGLDPPGRSHVAVPEGLSVASVTAARGADLVARAGELRELASEADLDDCRFVFPEVLVRGNGSGCFGPALEYEGHPDVEPGASTAGVIAAGELGMWSEQGEDGEACMASELNAEVEREAGPLRAALATAAQIACTLRNTERGLPKVGWTTTLGGELRDPLLRDNPDWVINRVHLTREANDERDREVYRYDLDFAVSLAQTGAIADLRISMRHHESEAVDGYRGSIWARVAGLNSVGEVRASSLVYELDPGGELTMEMRSAEIDPDGVELFDENDHVASSGDWIADFRRTLWRAPAAGALVTMTHARRSSPDAERWAVFQVWHDASEGEPRACAFFGHTDASAPSTEEGGVPEISSFGCYPSGLAAGLQSQLDRGQKQCMEGADRLVATRSAYAYAPVEACSVDADADFRYRRVGTREWQDGVTRDELVGLSDDSDFQRFAR